MNQDNLLKTTVSIAMVLALFVVTLGAYTRLTNAGLGCPDWPGCYGHMVLPQQTNALAAAQAAFPDVPVEQTKAWTEMVHRYIAGCLALLVFFIGVRAIYLRLRNRFEHWRLALLMIFLVCFQAALGMWTVTLKLLPVVVMAHLLGGMTLFSLLTYYRLRLTDDQNPRISRQFLLVLIGCVVVFGQVALGGWVSANYAGIACVGFPQCNGQWLPTMHLGQGFNLFSPIGENYQGGVLDNSTRVTIQMIHRFGALVTTVYVTILAIWLYHNNPSTLVRRCALFILSMLGLQVSLGIINVLFLLPLPVAVAHNGVAAMLMASMMAMLYLVLRRKEHVS